MDKDEAHDYLSSLLNQNLRIHTTDGRMFRGTFKCTDPVCIPTAMAISIAVLSVSGILICPSVV